MKFTQPVSVFLTSGGHLATYGDIFDRHNWRSAISIQWVEARDAAKHRTMHRIAPYHDELCRPKCQQQCCWETPDSNLILSLFIHTLGDFSQYLTGLLYRVDEITVDVGLSVLPLSLPF